MRYIVIIFLCTAHVCSAQETYHNEEFGFIINIPSLWHISLEDEWTNKVEATLEQLYTSKSLCMLNPEGVAAPDVPCIIVFGQETEGVTTSEAIASVKKIGEKMLISCAESLAKQLLGKNIRQYQKVDTFYDYDSSKYLAKSRILYKHNYEENIYFMVARAKFVGLQRVVDFRGYWKGKRHEEFQNLFNEVIDSFDFDPDAKPKGVLDSVPQEIKEASNLSKEKTFNRIWKWGGIVLTIWIVLGVAKILLDR